MQTFSATLAKPTLRGLGILLWLGIVAAAHATPALAQNQDPANNGSKADPVYRVTGPRGETQIVEKFSKIIETPTPIVRVDGFDPEVIEVTSITASSFRIQALAQGVTTVVFNDSQGQNYLVDVFVAGDVRHLQAYIDRLFPGSAVKAVAVRESVVLRGWVNRPQDIHSIVEISEQFYGKVLNQMQVGGAQQVILKVRVMEVQRSKIRQLGFNFLYLTRDGVLSSTPGSLVSLADLSTPFGGPQGAQLLSTTLAAPTMAAGVVSDNSIFQGFLEALKQERLLKILAEPVLNTANGRPAQMLAGGEFPILVPQSLGTTTIEYREFGVRLEAVPTILGDGRVRLELQPEVSERDFTNSVSINGFTVPGLTTRRVNTQVEMNFGETYMLAGLLSLRRTATTTKVPWLGELPWLGAAFRRMNYEEGETELVIMVTPQRAGALAPSQVPPGGPGMFTDVPTDRELYTDGLIEVPSYGDRCVSCQVDEGYLPSTRMHYAKSVSGFEAHQAIGTGMPLSGQTAPEPWPASSPTPAGTPTVPPGGLSPQPGGPGTLFETAPAPGTLPAQPPAIPAPGSARAPLSAPQGMQAPGPNSDSTAGHFGNSQWQGASQAGWSAARSSRSATQPAAWTPTSRRTGGQPMPEYRQTTPSSASRGLINP